MRGYRTFTFNPAVDTAIYAAGDRMGPASTKLTGLLRGQGFVLLHSIAVIDASKNAPGIEFLFWDSAPTIASADNAAFDLTDAEAAARFIGRFAFPTSAYRTDASNSIGSQYFINHLLPSRKCNENPEGRDMYFTMVATSTPTFAAATDLTLRMSFECDV